jgi:hypothetical protein
VPDAPLTSNCLNCGASFVPERRAFCPECGQETRLRAPTLGEFVQQFGGAYISTEGALWRTLKLLLLKPGELTRQYLAGRRKHYVLPLRLYLTISLLSLVLLRLVASGAVAFNVPDMELDRGEYNILALGEGRGAGLRDGKFYCKGLPAWTCQRLQRRLDTDPKGLQREAVAMSERFMANLGGAMFVMVPLFALFMKLTYWNRRLRYTEHLVFALHLHAFWFVCLMLTLPDWGWLTFIAFCAVPVYGFMALKRVYGGRFGWRFLRVSTVSLLYLVALVMLVVVVVLWSLLF